MKLNYENIFQELLTAIFEGDDNRVTDLIEKAISDKISTSDILDKALLPATKKVIDRYSGADFYIPDVISASHAIQAGLYILKCHTKITPKNSKKIIIGTVEGDAHDIGKNIIILFLKIWSFNVIDLGVDVTAKKFVESVKEFKPDVLAMSSLLTTTMHEMSKVIQALIDNNVRNTLKVLIGGGPVTSEFALSIGADLYASNAQATVQVLQKLYRTRT